MGRKVAINADAFKDTEVFVGIDVHLKSWQVTVRAMGMEFQTFSMTPCAQSLAEHLKKRYPGGRYRSAYEAGFCGFWIHRALIDNGIDNVVIHAADVPTTNKEKVTKTDKVDSRKIAQGLENGRLNGVYTPDVEDQQFRSLVRLRHACMGHQTRLKNRIRGHLYYYGITLTDPEVARHWSGAFLAELDRLVQAEHAAGTYLRFSLEEFRQQRQRLLELTRELRALCRRGRRGEIMRCLRSVPGVGFIIAVTMMSEIIDINRFPSLDHLCGFVGLVPSCNNSGEKEHQGGLSPRKNRHLRHMIIEAAWVAVRRDPELACCFAKLTQRMRKTEAIVRIAHKLLNRIRHVWKHNTTYVFQVPTAG
jgi:transposase